MKKMLNGPNQRVRNYLRESGVTQGDLAKLLYTNQSEISSALKYELAEEEQQKLIDIITEEVRRRGHNGKA